MHAMPGRPAVCRTFALRLLRPVVVQALLLVLGEGECCAGGGSWARRRSQKVLEVADGVHRLMGGWESLVSSQGYFQLNATKQFETTLTWTLKDRIPPKWRGRGWHPCRP